jgi:hypothetical protein
LEEGSLALLGGDRRLGRRESGCPGELGRLEIAGFSRVEKWLFQLRALAWAALAKAHRVQGVLTSSERIFEMSDAWWEAGAADIGDALG